MCVCGGGKLSAVHVIGAVHAIFTYASCTCICKYICMPTYIMYMLVCVNVHTKIDG